jgi:hypothetical protein
LISRKKAHRLIACEVLLPRSNLREDEAWAVRPSNKRKGLSATLDMCGRYAKKLVFNGRDKVVAAPGHIGFVLDLLHSPELTSTWEGCV